uniref:Uncharacterized protein n=2 Tax=Meloidogyne TaxID=189290 RepID=A0A914L6G2_MELIC
MTETTSENSETNQNYQAHSVNKKLQRPQIQLKRFDGNIENWCSFWETYRVLIHEDHSLSSVEKFNILDSILEDEAKDLLGGLQMTQEGYDTAIDLLLEKFGSERKLIRSLNQELLNLPQSENYEEDEKLHLRIEKLCRQLQSLKQDVDQAPYFMTLEGKISPEVLDKYCMIKDMEDNEDWNTAKFRNALGRALTQIRNKVEVKQTSKIVVRDKNKEGPTMNFALNQANRSSNKSFSPIRVEKPRGREEEKDFNSRRQFSGRRQEYPGSSSPNNFRRSPSPNYRERSPSPRRSRAPQRKGSPYPRRDSSSSGSRSPSRFPCQFCDKPHSPLYCRSVRTAEERKSKANERGLCFKCLGKGHYAKDCSRPRRRCMNCGRSSHHTALCERKYKQGSLERINAGVSATTTQIENPSVQLFCENLTATNSCIADPNNKMSILKMTYAHIYNPLRPELNKRELVFLDDGSQKSYIDENLAKELQLDVLEIKKFELSGINQANLGKFENPVVEFGVRAKKFDMLLRAGTLETILNRTPIFDRNKISTEQLSRNKLITQFELGQPKILIGNDYYNFFNVKPKQQFPSGIWLSTSTLGEIINGIGKVKLLSHVPYNMCSLVEPYTQKRRILSASTKNFKMGKIHAYDSLPLEANTSPEPVPDSPKQTLTKPNVVRDKQILEPDEKTELHMTLGSERKQDDDFFQLIRRMDSLQNIGLGDANIKEEAIKIEMEKKITFNGVRYQTELLWNEETAAKLPTNYDLAYGQLMSNLRTLRSKPQLLKDYDKIIQEQLQKGLIEKVDPLEDKYSVGRKVHYLPHHPVIKQTPAATKIRIVYNASAKKPNSFSLNQCLEKGPNLFNDLAGILLRSRMKKILLCGDIAKAFHMIELHPKDRDVVRFLWAAQPDKEDTPLVEYRFTRVTFGVICSPAHLALTIEMHLRQYQGPLVKQLNENAYVDNLLEGGMDVREFVSNSKEVEKIPLEDRIDKRVVKLLGTKWDTLEDEFIITLPKFEEKKITRRTVLAQLAKPFDPLGLIAPIILQAKLLRQQADAIKPGGWDRPLPSAFEKQWNNLMSKWEDKEIKLHRLIFPDPDQSNNRYQLHVFTDASIIALGAAIYLRIINPKYIHAQLIFGKSLVIPAAMPNTRKTIPSLELHATMLSCKYLLFVREQLEKELKIDKVQIWTDSIDVLDFLLSERKFDRFIKNRLNRIREFPVKHIAGNLNPADVASRGASPQELKENKVWWKGPTFLEESEAHWTKPLREFDPNSPPMNQKEDKSVYEMTSAVRSREDITPEPIIDYSRFSNWNRLVNTMAFVKRITRKCDPIKKEIVRKICLKPEPERTKRLFDFTHLHVKEIKKAEKIIIKLAQLEYPPSEDVKRNLDLYEDPDKIWRAKGRFNKSGMNYDVINPIFLSHKSPIVYLLIRKAHLDTKHGGIELINCTLRQKFWITHSRRTIGNWLSAKGKNSCGICARWGAKACTTPRPPDLPACRIQGSSAFQSVGVDYFGPFYTSGLENSKCWGAIFTCTLTRAVHLELVTDCTSEKFLLALTRFIRRRRTPQTIISDNATTFVLANKVVQDLCKAEREQKKEWIHLMGSKKVQDFFLLNQIQWKFNTPLSPWRGAFYERLIGSIKHHLYRIIGKKKIPFEELMTLLIEVERILNERPLTYYTSQEIVEPLRPIDILDCSAGKPFHMNLTPTLDKDPDYKPIESSRDKLLQIHQRALLKSHTFWREWRNTYLINLRERWHQTKDKKKIFPRENQIVLIKEENEMCPRSLWKLGKIQKMITDRTVELKVGDKVIVRPINLLYPLETENEELEEQSKKESSKVVLAESEEKVGLGWEEDRIKLEEKRNQVRLINEVPLPREEKPGIKNNYNNTNLNCAIINYSLEMASSSSSSNNNNNQLKPLTARSPFVIITDTRVQELREFFKNLNIRSMIFEPKVWDKYTLTNEIILNTHVDVCVIWNTKWIMG